MIKKFKILPTSVDFDLSYRSIDMLEIKISNYLKSIGNTYPTWYPDNDRYPENNSKEILNVVLMGGFIKRIFDIPNWQLSKILIWVLSQKTKDFLVESVGLEPRNIQVIPRYELFKKPPTIQNINTAKPIHIIYSGRFSIQKNFDVLLKIFNHLDKNSKIEFKLFCFGGYDNSFHENHGRFEKFEFKRLCTEYIQNQIWKNKPVILNWHDSESWTSKIPENSVIINLSTFISEDFGVSVAQAQSAGYKSFLTDWGGHSDCDTETVEFISPNLIPAVYEHENLYNLKIKTLCELIEMKIERIGTISKKIAEKNNHNITNIEDLKNIVQLFIENHSWPESLLIHKNGLPQFADTKKGSAFFDSFSYYFTGENYNLDTIYFVSDLNSDSSFSTTCLDQINNYKKNCTNFENTTFIILKSYADLKYKKDLLRSVNYVFTYFDPIHIKVIQYIKNLRSNNNFMIYVPAGSDPQILQSYEIKFSFY